MARHSTAQPLTHREALQLGAALIACIADNIGARVLLIKGDVLSAQGLRLPRVSADVDILVDPAHFEALVARLTGAGAARRFEAANEGRVLRAHSATMVLPWLGCEIDVHEFYPGFLAPPSQVFEELWSRRAHIRRANRDVPCTDALGSLAIHCLHSARSNPNWIDSSEVAHSIRAFDVDRIGRSTIQTFAWRTGSTGSLEQLWTALGVSVPLDRAHAERVAAWEFLVARSSPGAGSHVRALARSGWRFPLVAFRLAWPRHEDLGVRWLPATAERSAYTRARIRRLQYGLTSFPDMWRDAARSFRMRSALRSGTSYLEKADTAPTISVPRTPVPAPGGQRTQTVANQPRTGTGGANRPTTPEPDRPADLTGERSASTHDAADSITILPSVIWHVSENRVCVVNALSLVGFVPLEGAAAELWLDIAEGARTRGELQELAMMRFPESAPEIPRGVDDAVTQLASFGLISTRTAPS
ncbi:putative nucleotidyltransferase-like protein [Serinibacter salmoneus]|uniref:Putative nucleotidyltransferase-like protein n=1 Tax=Serinibacter salmoneus TaxID=556530 RepID=A0A2A9CXC9_9MICO|nr:putative nucleotidyltransferase-like protein [Serinibacter salmoneus]